MKLPARTARAPSPRAWLACAVACMAILPSVSLHAADSWPTRPIRIVVPFAPGGTTDLLARLIAEGLTQSLGQSVIVENKAGSGGNVGAAEVARAQPDGYTLLMGTPGPLAINPLIYANLPFRPETDFAPISYVADVPNVILANPATGLRTVSDLLAAARAQPGKLNWGSPGVGSTGHLMLELLKQKAKVDIVHVPYKGASQATNDLLGGQIQLSGDNLPTALPHINAGKLVALGVTTEREQPSAPGIATVGSTVPGYKLASWFVVVAPASTPKPIADRISAAIDGYLKQPQVAERLRTLGATAVGGTPEQLGAHLRAEQARYRDVVAAAGIKPE